VCPARKDPERESAEEGGQNREKKVGRGSEGACPEGPSGSLDPGSTDLAVVQAASSQSTWQIRTANFPFETQIIPFFSTPVQDDFSIVSMNPPRWTLRAVPAGNGEPSRRFHNFRSS
jgi:hypothetical protein